MANSFRELEARMSPPAALARSDAEAVKLTGEMAVDELLRQARATTQEELARRLNIKQATV